MAIEDDDPLSDDPFFSDESPSGDEHVNAWELDDQAGWLREQGYEPGDELPVTWEDSDGHVVQTTVTLPEGDWDDPDSWADTYDDLREFYEGIWDANDGEYEGAATAG